MEPLTLLYKSNTSLLGRSRLVPLANKPLLLSPHFFLAIHEKPELNLLIPPMPLTISHVIPVKLLINLNIPNWDSNYVTAVMGL